MLMRRVGRSTGRRRRRFRGRAWLVLPAATLSFAIWLAAPALSLDPYVPEPVDFELSDRLAIEPAGDSGWASRRRGAAVHSRVLTTPKRFNLVGLRWKGARSADLRMRVRLGAGRWSRWVTVPVDPEHGPDPGSNERAGAWTTSDPVWAGEADRVQYAINAARSVRDIRLHFVNSTGTATRLDRLRSGLRAAVSSAAVRVRSVLGDDASAQDTSQPEIVTRDQWGAGACPPRATPAYGEVKLAFVHHTVTANDYTPEQSAAMVLGICRYHRNSNGWNDIGYQFVVDKYGKIFEGRAGGIDRAVVGAQAQGYNSQSTGVSNLGTFSTTGQTEAGLAALAHVLSWKLAIHGVAPQGKVTVTSAGGATNRHAAGTVVTFEAISGHRDGNKTACPGDGLYSQLATLRGMVSTDTRTPSAISLGAERRNIPYGRKARLSGTLKDAGGGPLAGRAVQIQSLGTSSGARTIAGTVTAAGGTFAINQKLAFNRAVQAQFVGDAGLRPALSPPLAIGVRPRVTAAINAAASARVRVGQRVAVTGTVRPRKRTALLIVDRRGSDGAYRRILKEQVRVRLGRIRAARRFKRAGRYRLRLGVDRDTRNLSSRSEPLEIMVG
jgi:N-acetylmuramoyl-L-alanine amidase-like protein